MTGEREIDKEEHLHYLKVLKQNYSTFQPEVRMAIDFAIESLNNSNDVYVNNRKKLLSKLRTLFLARENLSKEINRLRKELNSLDNMIMQNVLQVNLQKK